MATVHSNPQFPPMDQEDAIAWRSVCGLLVGIVTAGLLFGIFAVILSTTVQ